jgi:hypothetical protein
MDIQRLQNASLARIENKEGHDEVERSNPEKYPALPF